MLLSFHSERLSNLSQELLTQLPTLPSDTLVIVTLISMLLAMAILPTQLVESYWTLVLQPNAESTLVLSSPKSTRSSSQSQFPTINIRNTTSPTLETERPRLENSIMKFREDAINCSASLTTD